AASGASSTMILSRSVTLKAGVRTFLPLTTTRPSVIHTSASRREQSPERAMTLARRSPVEGLAGVSLMGRTFMSCGTLLDGRAFEPKKWRPLLLKTLRAGGAEKAKRPDDPAACKSRNDESSVERGLGFGQADARTRTARGSSGGLVGGADGLAHRFGAFGIV